MTHFSHKPHFEKDTRTRLIVPIRKIVCQSEAGIENVNSLLSCDDQYCVMHPSRETAPFIVFDFGQELNGGVCLDIVQTRPGMHAQMRLRFGESVSEVMHEPDRDHAFHDFTLDFPCVSKQEIGNTGFRFLRIDLLDKESSVFIRNLHAIAIERNFEYKGYFESSSQLLNDIWHVGARTVHLCCQDYILDGIKRDRDVYAGDTHPQIHVIASVFGDVDIVGKTLSILRKRTSPCEWMNQISSYSLWWIISVWDWFEYTADEKFLRSNKSYMAQLVNNIISQIAPDGVQRLGGIQFMDWPTKRNDVAVSDGVQALVVWALKSAKDIFHILKDREMESICNVYVKLCNSVAPEVMNNKQAVALNILAGRLDISEVSQTSLCDDDLSGLSPWYAYYVLQARAQAGDYSACLDLLKRLWGGMLKLGATTFWEHFEEAWVEDGAGIDQLQSADKNDVHLEYGEHCYSSLRRSLCHGWAAGATAWLSREVLGIKILEPGFKRIAIAPKLLDLEYVRGRFPTPFGNIEVEAARKANGDIETNYKVPMEIILEESHCLAQAR